MKKYVPAPPPPAPFVEVKVIKAKRPYDRDTTPGQGGLFGIGNRLNVLPRALPTAELVIQSGQDYLQWCQDNPIRTEAQSAASGKLLRYEVLKDRVPSLIGWASFVGVGEGTVRQWTRNKDPEYAEAAKRVCEAIKASQIEGGSAGIYHAQIVTRLAGLSEKIEATTVDLTPPPPETDPIDVVNKLHPNAPYDEKYGENPLLFSQRQLNAGVLYPMKTVEGT